MNSIEVLLVEDNIYDAELTMDVLHKHHLANHIVHVRDGMEALDYIKCEGKFKGRADKCPLKLILLDLHMPKINGSELIRVLKADPETQNIPIVLLISSTWDPEVQASEAQGVTNYIVKPVDFDNFIKAVSQAGLYWILDGNGDKAA